MPIYTVEVTGPVGRDWQPPPPPEPGVPTGLAATRGNAQVRLGWTEPVDTVGITNYAVQYKLATATTYTGFTHAASTATTISVTGLVNGTAYDFRVAAIVSGNTGPFTAPVRATPIATATNISTIFGYNTDDAAPLSERLAHWNNRAPIVRRYSGGGYGITANFQITTAVAPEKRVCYSTKADASGTFSKAGLAAGNGNALLTAWCESIPANWYVALCYYHEPNDDIRGGTLTVAQYRNTYEQFRTAIDNATLAPGVTVKLISNFMGYRVADTGPVGGPSSGASVYFHDDWVPPVGVADMMTFDVYGNPGHFTTQLLAPNCALATGSEYGASLPNVNTRFRDIFAAIERNGFADHWGLLELNAPPRDWDGPANPDYVCGTNKRLRYQGGRTVAGHDATHTEVERAAWMKAASDLCLNPPMAGNTPAEILLYWEHPSGVNWNQAFFHQRMWDTLKPYIIGTPVGGATSTP